MCVSMCSHNWIVEVASCTAVFLNCDQTHAGHVNLCDHKNLPSFREFTNSLNASLLHDVLRNIDEKSISFNDDGDD